ncbi:MAG: hypothetical protein AB7K68_13020 [Bacteriovoracia bacterium]
MSKNEGIPFDGFGSVLEMLNRSDAAFREKILANVRKRDPHLAHRLEAELRPARQATPSRRPSREEESRAALERGQRAAFTRNYGQ